MVLISVEVNGTKRQHEVEPRLLLVQYLRETLGLTGTNIGCDTSSCGACTVLLNGESVKSCTLLAAQADEAEILTIEGLGGPDGTLHPVQEAFREHHALQCGYCTPGMVMAAVSLLAEEGQLDEQGVREGLEGNLCRCTGYHNIVQAVLACADDRGALERVELMIPAAFDYARAGSTEEAIALARRARRRGQAASPAAIRFCH